MIRAANLSKSFGRVTAVRDVSFHAPDGAVTCLLGPNGAGKSTTVRMLHGLLQPDTGAVEIDGFNVEVDPVSVRRRLGVLPDALGLYPRLTARENIEYFGRLQGLSESALDARVETLAETLSMAPILGRKTEGFSQGERMKVALARALVHRPQNLILDEPTNGLDVMSTRAVRQLLTTLRDEGCCVVFSSHIMQEVEALSDHIIIISDGRVVAAGTSTELQDQAGCTSLEDAFVAFSASDVGAVS